MQKDDAHVSFSITFSAPMNAETVNHLIHVVAEKIKSGERKLDLVITASDGDINQAKLAFNFLKSASLEVTTGASKG